MEKITLSALVLAGFALAGCSHNPHKVDGVALYLNEDSSCTLEIDQEKAKSAVWLAVAQMELPEAYADEAKECETVTVKEMESKQG